MSGFEPKMDLDDPPKNEGQARSSASSPTIELLPISPSLGPDRNNYLRSQWTVQSAPAVDPTNESAVREWLQTLPLEVKESLLQRVISGHGTPRSLTEEGPNYLSISPDLTLPIRTAEKTPLQLFAPDTDRSFFLRPSSSTSQSDPMSIFRRSESLEWRVTASAQDERRASSMRSVMQGLELLQEDLPPLSMPLDQIPEWAAEQAKLKAARVEARLARLDMMAAVTQECLDQHQSPKALSGKLLGGAADFIEWVGIQTGYNNFRRQSILTLTNVLESDFPAIKERVQQGQRLEVILLDYPVLSEGLQHFDFRISDPRSSEEAYRELNTLAKFFRGAHNYDQAGEACLQVLKEDFQNQIDKISPERQEALKLQASTLTAAWVLQHEERWRNPTAEDQTKGIRPLSDEQIKTLREGMEQENFEYLLRKELAAVFDPSHLYGAKREAWDLYNDIFDPQGEFFNLADETWDRIAEEVAINAPLIAVSGGAGALVRAGVSAAARGVACRIVGRAALETCSGWLARRGALQLGIRLAGRSAGLLVEGAAFETTFEALHGRNLWTHDYGDESKWERIISSSVMLGMFKGAGSLSERAFSRGTAGGVRELTSLGRLVERVPHPTLQAMTKQLLLRGQAEAAALVLHQAVSDGILGGGFSREDYWNDVGDSLLSFYIQSGALNLGHAAADLALTRRGALRRLGRDLEAGDLSPEVLERIGERAEARRRLLSEPELPAEERLALQERVKETEKDIKSSNEAAAKSGKEILRQEQWGALKERVREAYDSAKERIENAWTTLRERILHPIDTISKTLRLAGRAVIAGAEFIGHAGCDAVRGLFGYARSIFTECIKLPGTILTGVGCLTSWTLQTAYNTVALPFRAVNRGIQFGAWFIQESQIRWASRGTGESEAGREIAEGYLADRRQFGRERDPVKRAEIGVRMRAAIDCLASLRIENKVSRETRTLIDQSANSFNIPDQRGGIREQLGRSIPACASPHNDDQRAAESLPRRPKVSADLFENAKLLLEASERERAAAQERAAQERIETELQEVAEDLKSHSDTPRWLRFAPVSRMRALILTAATLFPSLSFHEAFRSSGHVEIVSVESHSRTRIDLEVRDPIPLHENAKTPEKSEAATPNEKASTKESSSEVGRHESLQDQGQRKLEQKESERQATKEMKSESKQQNLRTAHMFEVTLQEVNQQIYEQQLQQAEERKEKMKELREEEQRKKYRGRLLHFPMRHSSGDPDIPDFEDDPFNFVFQSSEVHFQTENTHIPYQIGRRVWIEITSRPMNEQNQIHRRKRDDRSPDTKNPSRDAHTDEETELVSESYCTSEADWVVDKEFLDSAFETPTFTS